MFIFETTGACSTNQVGLCTLQKGTNNGKKVSYDIDDFLYKQNKNTKNFHKIRKEESQEGQQYKKIPSCFNKIFDDDFKPNIKINKKTKEAKNAETLNCISCIGNIDYIDYGYNTTLPLPIIG